MLLLVIPPWIPSGRVSSILLIPEENPTEAKDDDTKFDYF
jgi:hypothetical protein